jgi:hypothetical protein
LKACSPQVEFLTSLAFASSRRRWLVALPVPPANWQGDPLPSPTVRPAAPPQKGHERPPPASLLRTQTRTWTRPRTRNQTRTRTRTQMFDLACGCWRRSGRKFGRDSSEQPTQARRRKRTQCRVHSRAAPADGRVAKLVTLCLTLVLYNFISPSPSQRDEPDRLCPRKFKGAGPRPIPDGGGLIYDLDDVRREGNERGPI